MSRTPVPKHLIHKTEEVTENAKLFDALVDLFNPIFPIIFDPQDTREVRQLITSKLLENIKQKVESEGELRLPFGLVIRRDS